MTLEQLRIFLEVAAQEHVTRAAQRLNLTQSAVSAAVSALEQRHDIRLFDRVGRGIALTHEGRAFIPHARDILRRAEDADRFLSDLRGGATGTLRIEASQTVASYFLPRYLMAFRAAHPDATLEFAQGNTSTTIEAVLNGEADLGVVEGAVDEPMLRRRAIGGDRLMLLTGREHPWASGRPVTLQDLTQAEWVAREPGSGTRAAFDEVLAAEGIFLEQVRPVLELPSNEACIAAVERGRGATVLSELAAAPHLAQKLVIEAARPLPRRSFLLIHHRQRHPGRLAQMFSDQFPTHVT